MLKFICLTILVQDSDDLLPCPPNYMRCPQEERCIPIYQFCDNTVHCAINGGDEGDFCTQSKSCDMSLCIQSKSCEMSICIQNKF